MRLKQTHTFLRGGYLFFYRDIFSGLSNETTGAASYNIPARDPVIHQLIATVNTYQRLLYRYALFIAKNKLVASLIVEEVIDMYAKNVNAIPASEIKSFLKVYTYEKCDQWLIAKSEVLNIRKPKNPT